MLTAAPQLLVAVAAHGARFAGWACGAQLLAAVAVAGDSR